MGHVEVHIIILIEIEECNLIHRIVCNNFVHGLIDVPESFVDVGHVALLDSSFSIVDFYIIC